MTTPQQQVLEKCKAVLASAQARYGIDMSRVAIRFDLRGRAAGQAGRRASGMFIRFNADMLKREAFNHVLNNTVPHEIAHLVCFMNPAYGKGHDAGWERVCIALGGSGATRHQEEVVYGKGYTYEYTTTNGETVRVGDRYHNAIQSGSPIRYRHGKGQINPYSNCNIVGYQGRTLDQPRFLAGKHPAAASTPAVSQCPGRTAAEAQLLAQLDRFMAASGAVPSTPPQQVIVNTPAPAPIPAAAPVTRFIGQSKAEVSRRIMSTMHARGESYEAIIAQMMSANGYNRQLARATYKANAARAGVPQQG